MKIIPFLFLFCLCAFQMYAQEIQAVKIELNASESSYPNQYTVFQGGFFYEASHQGYGKELWYFSEALGHSYLVKDINNGYSSDIEILGATENYLFFTADTYGSVGRELWISDATLEGTHLLKDIDPEYDNFSGPEGFIYYNGLVYFSADDGLHGRELWRSDGTENGTYMIKDLNPGEYSSHPTSFQIVNDDLLFFAHSINNGTELWKSNGTPDGTFQVIDINNNESSSIGGTVSLVYNDNLYFYANDGYNGFELWKSDGSNEGTSLVKDIYPGVSSSSYGLEGLAIDGGFLFIAENDVYNKELYFTDGSQEGTYQVIEINTSSTAFYSDPSFVEVGGKGYFLADDGIHGLEIWSSDGTQQGTSLLKDFTNGSGVSHSTSLMADLESERLLFFADDQGENYKLWSSNGTEEGTSQIADIEIENNSAFNEGYLSYNGYTILTAKNEVNGVEIFRTDGTSQGTDLFEDVNVYFGVRPTRFFELNNEVYFIGFDGAYNSIYKTNGTIDGSRLITKIEGAIDESSFFTEMDNVMYFKGGSSNGKELWRTDGTAEGTYQVKDIGSGYYDGLYYTYDVFASNGLLYFTADDSETGYELWISDGTEAGTFLLRDIYVTAHNNSDSSPSKFEEYGDYIYFRAIDGYSTTNVWKTNGTEEGTSVAFELNDTRVIERINDRLIMVAETSGTTYGPHDLWAYDFNQEELYQIDSFGDGINSNIRSYAIYQDSFVFVAKSNETLGKAVFSSDGTQDSVITIFDITLDGTSSASDAGIGIIGVCGDYVYFVAGGANGDELYRTNGTSGNYELIEDDVTPNGFNHIKNFTCLENDLFYTNDSNPNQALIKVSNAGVMGITQNIEILNDFEFEEYEGVNELFYNNGLLYFAGNTDRSGEELYTANILGETLINCPFPIDFYIEYVNGNVNFSWNYLNEPLEEFNLIIREVVGHNVILDVELDTLSYTMGQDLFQDDIQYEAILVAKCNQQYNSSPIVLYFDLNTLSNERLLFEPISVYPNPVSNRVYFSSKINIVSVSIYDGLGKVVREELLTLGANSLDVSDLSVGLYFFEFKGDNQRQTVKVLKSF